MWESGAIIDNLIKLYDTEHKLAHSTPSRGDEHVSAQRAKFLQLKQFIIAATVYPFVASWYIHSLQDAAEQDAVYLESAATNGVLVLCLGVGPYFMGDQMTVASLLVAKPWTKIHAMGLLPAFPTRHSFFLSNRESAVVVSTRP
jgi:glutathione S-transferase